MESFLKRVIEKRTDEEAHRYFVRFGKGKYNKRFILSFNKSKTLKLKASFELANDFVKFVNENKDLPFSGKILTKNKIPGKEGKKKAGVFVYEVSESKINEFENPYFYLLDTNDSEVILKIKKSLPKPGKNEDKIDDSFCSLELDLKYWPKIKETFFWDVPECKKAVVAHDLLIKEIVFPKNEKDPVKIRELAKRKGVLVKRIIADGNESSKEYDFEV